MSKLIINEEPLLVLPSLAKSIGLNEAVFYNKFSHYLMNQSIFTMDITGCVAHMKIGVDNVHFGQSALLKEPSKD